MSERGGENQNSELRAAHQLLHHPDIDEDSEVAQPRLDVFLTLYQLFPHTRLSLPLLPIFVCIFLLVVPFLNGYVVIYLFLLLCVYVRSDQSFLSSSASVG